MSDWTNLNDVLDLRLRLPIGGRTYIVEPPSAADGAYLMNLMALGLAADAGVDVTGFDLDISDGNPDFGARTLGAAYQQMLDDGLSMPQVGFAAETAFLAWTVSKEYAEHHWETGGKAGRPNRAQRRHPTATPTPAAAANTTQTPASRNGTKTRRKKRKGRR